jgi:pyruvate ferredoxin oxidoreductase alpha subunit
VLDLDKPLSFGSLDLQDYYFEHKRSQIEAMNTCLPIIEKAHKAFADKFGRYYPIVDEYKMDDAEVAILCLGSTGGTAKVAVERMRAQGKKVGVIRPRVYRPFPKDQLLKALAKVKAVAILDRAETMSGQGGHLYGEVRAILYDAKFHPFLKNYVYGLGGRDISIEELESIYDEMFAVQKSGKVDKDIVYFGVRGE